MFSSLVLFLFLVIILCFDFTAVYEPWPWHLWSEYVAAYLSNHFLKSCMQSNTQTFAFICPLTVFSCFSYISTKSILRNLLNLKHVFDNPFNYHDLNGKWSISRKKSMYGVCYWTWRNILKKYFWTFLISFEVDMEIPITLVLPFDNRFDCFWKI